MPKPPPGRQRPPPDPSDPSRRRFLATGSATLAGLAVARPAGAARRPARVSWSTWRACPGDEVMALAEVPGASDGTPVRFEVVRPDGSLLGLVGSSRGGHAAVPVRLDLPPACARPGRHVFELTACVPGWGGPGTGPARVEVIAARFSFGL